MGKDLKGKELGKGISQRGDGTYNARASVNGFKINLYDKNLSQLRKDFEQQKAVALRKELAAISSITLEEWYRDWFKSCKAPLLKGEINRHNYNRRMENTFLCRIGSQKLCNLSQFNIQAVVNDLTNTENEKHYSIRLVREALSNLRDCLESAVVNELIRVNPAKTIIVKSIEVPDERVVLTKKQQEKFLEFAKDSYYYEMYQILLSTGMRAGEFSGLQWGDVDFENNCIHIRRSLTSAYVNGKKILELTTTKTINSVRRIPMFDGVDKIFKVWKEKQDRTKSKLGDRWRCPEELGDLVFTTTMGSPATRYVLKRDIDCIVNNINMADIDLAIQEGRTPVKFPKVHPHAFRHTFATRCFEKNLQPLFIKEIMGHTNYSTTISYTHILDELVKTELVKAGSFVDDESNDKANKQTVTMQNSDNEFSYTNQFDYTLIMPSFTTI